MAPAGRRRGLRVIEKECPAWADGLTRLREPSARAIDEFQRTEGTLSDMQRVAAMLGLMVLDEDTGEPVGMDAILDASPVAIQELERAAAELFGNNSGPLAKTSDSDTGSPLPSAA